MPTNIAQPITFFNLSFFFVRCLEKGETRCDQIIVVIFILHFSLRECRNSGELGRLSKTVFKTVTYKRILLSKRLFLLNRCSCLRKLPFEINSLENYRLIKKLHCFFIFLFSTVVDKFKKCVDLRRDYA